MNDVPDCASLNGGQTAPATVACRSTVPPLGWRLCFLQAGGEVGGDWWGDTTGDVASGWGQKTWNIHFHIKTINLSQFHVIGSLHL